MDTFMQSGMPRGRREEKKIQARKDILNAAVRKFRENGYQATSIADIMTASEMGLGTFYNYFSSKEDILRCLLNQLTSELAEQMAELRHSGRPYGEVLQEMALSTTKLVASNQFLLPLLFAGAMGGKGHGHGHGHSHGDGAKAKQHPHQASGMPAPQVMMTFLSLIKEGQAKGEFRADISAEVISELFHSMFQTAAYSKLGIPFEENIKMKLQILIDGIKAR